MPAKPPKKCSYPRCPNKATEGARCEQHKHPAWSGGRSQEKRVLKGRTLQTERKRLFRKNPLCSACLKVGVDRVGVIRDHIIPLAFGGEDIESNTQNLCVACHTAKTKEESKRGISSK